jgi:hypothetical protein
MKAFGVVLAGFAVIAFSFVLLREPLLAQDTKEEKKTEEKKDDEKKAEKKTVRLADATDVNRAKKKLGRVKDVKTDEPAELIIMLEDLSKMPEYRDWATKQQKAIAAAAKDRKAYAEKKKHFQDTQAAEYNKLIYVGDELQIPISETVRIRSVNPPRVFGEDGKEKKLTSTQLSALKSPPLLGYKCEMSDLKVGQIVEIYVKPPPPAPKGTPAPMPVAKKGPIGADPKDVGPSAPTKTEAYMILIKQEAQ